MSSTPVICWWNMFWNIGSLLFEGVWNIWSTYTAHPVLNTRHSFRTSWYWFCMATRLCSSLLVYFLLTAPFSHTFLENQNGPAMSSFPYSVIGDLHHADEPSSFSKKQYLLKSKKASVCTFDWPYSFSRGLLRSDWLRFNARIQYSTRKSSVLVNGMGNLWKDTWCYESQPRG